MPPMTPFQHQEMLGDIYVVRKMYRHAILLYSGLLREEPKCRSFE